MMWIECAKVYQGMPQNTMKKRYKVILNVEITDPDKPFPAGGDYTHLSRIEGLVHSIASYWPGLDATITLDKVIDKGEITNDFYQDGPN